jgi:hypothetical protein
MLPLLIPLIRGSRRKKVKKVVIPKFLPSYQLPYFRLTSKQKMSQSAALSLTYSKITAR